MQTTIKSGRATITLLLTRLGSFFEIDIDLNINKCNSHGRYMLGPRALERRKRAAHTGTNNYEDFFGGKYNIEVNPKLSPKHLLNLSLMSQPCHFKGSLSYIMFQLRAP